MLKVRVGECADTQADQGVDGHPSSHLLTPERNKRPTEREEQKITATTNQLLKKNSAGFIFTQNVKKHTHYTKGKNTTMPRSL